MDWRIHVVLPQHIPDISFSFLATRLYCSAFVSCLIIKNKAPQYHISSEAEDRPSDNSNDGEWWPDEVDLDAVTTGNMSIDSKPVATDGERGRYRDITVDSGARESVVNTDDWPNADLKQSESSVK